MAPGDPTDQILNIEAEFIKIANTLNEIINELRSYQQTLPEKLGEIKQEIEVLRKINDNLQKESQSHSNDTKVIHEDIRKLQESSLEISNELQKSLEFVVSGVKEIGAQNTGLQKKTDEIIPGFTELLKPIEDKTNEFQGQFVHFNNEYRTNCEQHNERHQNHQSQLQEITILSKEIHQQTESLSSEIQGLQQNISDSKPSQDLWQKIDSIITSQKTLSDSVHNAETRYFDLMPLIQKYSENLEKIEGRIDLLNRKVDSIPKINGEEIQKRRENTDNQLEILQKNSENTNRLFMKIIYVLLILFVVGSLFIVGSLFVIGITMT